MGAVTKKENPRIGKNAVLRDKINDAQVELAKRVPALITNARGRNTRLGANQDSLL